MAGPLLLGELKLLIASPKLHAKLDKIRNTERSYMSEWSLAVVILVGAAVYLRAIMDLPKAGLVDVVGPQFFPALVCAGLFVSGVLLIFENIGRRKQLLRNASASSTADTGHDPKIYPILLGVFLWTALYYAVFEPLGYLIATPVYIFALLNFFHKTKWWFNLMYAVAFTLIAYGVFSQVLGVVLPSGILAN